MELKNQPVEEVEVARPCDHFGLFFGPGRQVERKGLKPPVDYVGRAVARVKRDQAGLDAMLAVPPADAPAQQDTAEMKYWKAQIVKNVDPVEEMKAGAARLKEFAKAREDLRDVQAEFATCGQSHDYDGNALRDDLRMASYFTAIGGLGVLGVRFLPSRGVGRVGRGIGYLWAAAGALGCVGCLISMVMRPKSVLCDTVDQIVKRYNVDLTMYNELAPRFWFRERTAEVATLVTSSATTFVRNYRKWDPDVARSKIMAMVQASMEVSREEMCVLRACRRPTQNHANWALHDFHGGKLPAVGLVGRVKRWFAAFDDPSAIPSA